MNQIGGSDVFSDLSVDMESRTILQATTKWARIAAIIGMVSAVLTLLTSIMSMSGVAGAGANSQMMSMVMRGSLIFIIPVVVAIIVVNIFLLRFATSTGAGLDNMRQEAFNQGINFLKMYFKTLGVIIIVILGLVLILMIAFALGASMG